MNSIFKDKSNSIKVIHILLYVVTILYILETIFIRGMFTNFMIAGIDIVLGIIAFIISLIKKEYNLAIVDFIIFTLVSGAVIYLMYM